MAAAIIDLWSNIRDLFIGQEQVQPEIYIFNLSTEAMREALQYIVQNSRDVETSFIDFYENRQYVNSVNDVLDGLIGGDILGEIWCDVLIEGYRLPSMGFYSDEPGFIVIDYVMGDHWNPLRVTALFEFFRMVKLWDNGTVIRVNPRHFGQARSDRFDQVLEAYLRERK